ncbi:tetratricopeptide repeat protein [Altericista sp. CCNU0014]|uniref:tetratricopeptide repeat protein n=1 Tax=Altericista sp. CCNU0014 TaxID=3082949 RepID=UPI00384BB877
MRDRYQTLLTQLVEKVLKGHLPSKEQVYRELVQDLEPDSAEILDECLQEQLSATQLAVTNAVDEIKQAKATRSLRALKTIQGEWERYQKDRGASNAIAASAQVILRSEPDRYFAALVKVLDANQAQPLNLEQLKQLASTLKQAASMMGDANASLQQVISGIRAGLASWKALEPHLISWMYEQSRDNLGFEGTPGQRGPWQLWAQQVSSPLLQSLFQGLALNQPVTDSLNGVDHTLQDWIDLALALQLTQRGLVTWFEQQPYDSKWGTQQSIATFLSFAVLWGQLSAGIEQATSVNVYNREPLSQGCFQMALQTLRAFTQRPYFPLYGGVFALLSGRHLQDALAYLDEPLRQADGTQEKARMLTLLGYSQRAMGQIERSLEFHQQALEIAHTANDTPCEIANLNHISRTYLSQKLYTNAIGSAQRALVLARQRGDRLGEANALTNLGYAQILTAQQIERLIPEASDVSIGYLKEGLRLSEQLGDRQSQSLCCNSLGIAYGLLEQHEEAILYLQQGLQAAQRSGDLYLQGLNWSYLAESYYRLGDYPQAIGAGLLSLYGLEQIQAPEQSQPMGLLRVVKGRMGAEAFAAAVRQCRAGLLPFIGVDGFDHALHLLSATSQD